MQIKVGDEVAILPRAGALASDAIDLANVHSVKSVLIQLQDGRMFATIGLKGLNTPGTITLATDEHRQAVMARGSTECV